MVSVCVHGRVFREEVWLYVYSCEEVYQYTQCICGEARCIGWYACTFNLASVSLRV